MTDRCRVHFSRSEVLTANTLEERVALIERDFAEVKRLLSELLLSHQETQKDWRQACGSMKDFPEFDEVIRLGREYRKSFPYACDES